jgi:predicted flap endonuclease-1-like 5' DNA nuclease
MLMIWAARGAWARFAQVQAMEFPWWAWIFLVVFLVFLVFGVWARAQGKGVVKPEKDLISAVNEPRSQPRPKPGSVAATNLQPETVSPARMAEQTQAKSDNLAIVEGIGPRIAAILVEAGISSFTQLAAAKPEDLRGVIKAAGLRVPTNPDTWPDQARLAAAGEWEALRKMQASLKAGRKVD